MGGVEGVVEIWVASCGNKLYDRVTSTLLCIMASYKGKKKSTIQITMQVERGSSFVVTSSV